MAANGWLDDLSEEWIEQPRSSSSNAPSPRPSSVHQHAPVASTPAQSRIPRMRKASNTLPTSRRSSQSMNAGTNTAPKRRDVLAERSLSDENMRAGTPPISPDQKSPRSRLPSRSMSVASMGSVLQTGTIELKPKGQTPTRAENPNHTPEWRRRLLKGQMGYKDQKDLFSPMGIENMFAQPQQNTAGPLPNARSKRGIARLAEALPSSPPPWPSRAQRQQEVAGDPDESSLCIGGDEDQSEAQIDEHDGDESSTGSVARHRGPDASRMQAYRRTSPSARSERSTASNAYGARTISGETVLSAESFSPVYISKNNTIDSRHPHAVFDPPRSHTGNFTAEQRALSPASNEGSENERHDAGNGDGSSFARVADETLPADLPVGTPEVMANLGRFVSTRRGGYSADGSFQRRPLSSAASISQSISGIDQSSGSSSEHTYQQPEPDSPTEKLEESVLPAAPTPPIATLTPSPPKAQRSNEDRSRSSGSPLKLFGHHDTFTANRLHRRLSQLELNGDLKDISTAAGQENQTLAATKVDLSAVEETSYQEVITREIRTTEKKTKQRFVSRESWGTGALDDYEFPQEEFSTMSGPGDQARGSNSDSLDGSPKADPSPPGSRPMFQFRLDESPSLKSGAHKSRRTSSKSKRSMKTTTTRMSFGQLASPKLRDRQNHHGYESDAQDISQTGGKRPWPSPAKDPTPKRRRTLHRDEVLEGANTTTEQVKEQSAIFQSVIGRKRKDARHGMSSNVADSETLAKRQILRPRNPTPSQRRREQIQAEILDATEAYMKSSPPRLNAIREDLDHSDLGKADEVAQAKAVANEVAAFTLRVNKAMKDDSRKKSVTTQDFLDEAMKIMDFIRTKGRPTSGLGSLEESESEDADAQFSPYEASPSGMSYSRPVSRNGPASGWRNPHQQDKLDPDVANQLRRYQEGSSEFMPASQTSSPAIASRHSSADTVQVTHEEVHTLDDDRIRIHDSPMSRPSTANPEVDSKENSQKTQASTMSRTNPSYTSSAGRSIYTSTSKCSEAVATLAPEAVAHLIPEEVAGMSFDREKNCWVRKRSPTKERPSEISLNESEDDPFANIPDLTVDETEVVKRAPATSDTTTHIPPGVSGKDFGQWSRSQPSGSSRPQTREESKTFESDRSTVASKPHQFASSTDPIETRATSWSEEEMKARSKRETTTKTTEKHVLHADEIEHEILINEGRKNSPKRVSKIRDVTITFSSPMISRFMNDMQEQSIVEGEDAIDEEDAILDVKSGYTRKVTMTSQRHTSQKSRTTRSKATRTRADSQAIPVINEVDEVSMITDTSDPRQTRYSVNVTGTVTRRDTHQPLTVPSPAKGDVTFFLSDLPDFSINQVDERELPDRVIAKRNGDTRVEDRFGQGTADLVRALQDEEPNEPYWEDLRSVDLRGKGLSTIHRLDAFCWRLEEADLSGNALSEVHGAPAGLRRFSVRSNCLSSLTSWGHLMNLQYLDVSGNDIDDLMGFAHLVHLRELRVDDNRVVDISGIFGLDGLIKLSARGNRIQAVDFGGSNLQCIEELDLSENQIDEVHNLHCLPKLQRLVLDNNSMTTFPSAASTTTTASDPQSNTHLKHLHISSNALTTLTIHPHFPHLTTLHADRNRLLSITGLDTLRHLHSFSAQNQRSSLITASSSLTPATNPNPQSELLEVPFGLTHLRLSTNVLMGLGVPRSWYLLQRLEVAECALQSLPADFGSLVPNLRYLNLNFNGLKDLSPLLNTKALADLHIAGNRLARQRKNLAVLSRLADLERLDMRDNPLTVGFYGPSVDTRLITTNGSNGNLRSSAAEEEQGQHGTEDEGVDALTLPLADPEADAKRRELLDPDTLMRRRVYETLLACGNERLRWVDGLPFNRAAAMSEDVVLERLKLIGVLKKSGEGDGEA